MAAIAVMVVTAISHSRWGLWPGLVSMWWRRCRGEARTAGVREPVEAYAADAFCRVLDRSTRRTGNAPEPADGHSRDGDTVNSGDEGVSGVRPGEDWSFAKMIVRVDLTALDRGALAPGEICEIAGQGPIPVTDAWRIIDGGAFIAAVTTDGTDIDKIIHLGRRPTALQRTALEWYSAGECCIEGCTSPARIEIDHVADWAHTHTTTLPDLASPCGHHHDLKTHHGYTYGPRLPSGKRQLIPPDPAGPAGTTAEAGTDPPNLFDTS